MADHPVEKSLGRNEPCHCGSGKKYKRCHGVNAAPKLSEPKGWGAPGAGGAGGAGNTPGASTGAAFPGGFDPSQLDPQMMMQFTQALQRLPRGQLQRLQGIMQRAMSGQDVTRDAEEFERTLPVELQELMRNFGAQMTTMGAMGAGAQGTAALPGMDLSLPSLPSALSPANAESPASGMTEEQARQIVAAAAAEGKIAKDEAEKLLASTSSGTEEEKKRGFSKFWSSLTGKNS